MLCCKNSQPWSFHFWYIIFFYLAHLNPYSLSFLRGIIEQWLRVWCLESDRLCCNASLSFTNSVITENSNSTFLIELLWILNNWINKNIWQSAWHINCLFSDSFYYIYVTYNVTWIVWQHDSFCMNLFSDNKNIEDVDMQKWYFRFLYITAFSLYLTKIHVDYFPED